MIFSPDDIHKIRVQTDERRSKMSKEAAERDFRESVERGRKAIAAAKNKHYATTTEQKASAQ